MKPSSMHERGFTLLEVMIASSLGVVVIATGLVVGTQMQKRALFEEQTMTAQVTGRAVKEMLTMDLSRAGMGMGNTHISFKDDDVRSAITVWRKPDLKTGAGTTLGADPTFEPPPAGFPVSDALQLYWGDTNGMVTLAECDGTSVRDTANTTRFCAKPQASTAMVTPTGPATAILVSGGNKLACPVSITGINPGAAGTLSSITINNGGANAPSPTCNNAAQWQKAAGTVENWLALRLGGAAYRVNWRGGIPTLEVRAPSDANWSVLSRDVEQLTVREGVVNLGSDQNVLNWYPGVNAGVTFPAISECDKAMYDLGNFCRTDVLSPTGAPLPAVSTYPDVKAEIIRRLRQRVRELEVTLVIRTRRTNRDADMSGQDEEGLAKDGYTRRRYTFIVTARNMTVGLSRPPADPAGGT